MKLTEENNMKLTEENKKNILEVFKIKGYESVYVNELGYWFKENVALLQLEAYGYSKEEALKMTKVLTKKDLTKTLKTKENG